MPLAVAFLRRQVEQQHRHAGVGEVRGDLRAHDAGAEHGGLADDGAWIVTAGCRVAGKRGRTKRCAGKTARPRRVPAAVSTAVAKRQNVYVACSEKIVTYES